MFADVHASLAASSSGSFTYVYRPLVAAGDASQRQSLQGYGVQLAIKNMEYKAMDDKALEDLDNTRDEELAAGQEDVAAEEVDEQGFFFGTLGSRRPELKESLLTFKDVLADAGQDSSELKVWALQDLGLQASDRVLTAKEPLRTLRELCQNFPFVARSLSKSKTSRDLEEEVNRIQSSFWGVSHCALHGPHCSPWPPGPWPPVPQRAPICRACGVGHLGYTTRVRGPRLYSYDAPRRSILLWSFSQRPGAAGGARERPRRTAADDAAGAALC